MGSIVKPKIPKAVTPPPPPMVDQAMIDRQTQDKARRRRGVAATQLAGPTGPGTVSIPTLGG